MSKLLHEVLAPRIQACPPPEFLRCENSDPFALAICSGPTHQRKGCPQSDCRRLCSEWDVVDVRLQDRRCVSVHLRLRVLVAVNVAPVLPFVSSLFPIIGFVQRPVFPNHPRVLPWQRWCE
ncbi:hypothetical protein AAHE18_17G076200 [Arachis hypogaea]